MINIFSLYNVYKVIIKYIIYSSLYLNTYLKMFITDSGVNIYIIMFIILNKKELLNNLLLFKKSINKYINIAIIIVQILYLKIFILTISSIDKNTIIRIYFMLYFLNIFVNILKNIPKKIPIKYILFDVSLNVLFMIYIML